MIPVLSALATWKRTKLWVDPFMVQELKVESGNWESRFHLLGQAKRNFRWEGGRDNTALADSLVFELAEKQHSAAGVP